MGGVRWCVCGQVESGIYFLKYNEVALFIQVNRVFKECFVEVTLAAKKLFRGG